MGTSHRPSRHLKPSIASLLAITLFAGGWSVAQAAPATQPSITAFRNLPSVNGGPDWTFDDIAQQAGAGPRLTIDPHNPPNQIADENQALRTVLDLLLAGTDDNYTAAFRLTSATARVANRTLANRLLTLLYHNGIGTRADSNAAVRTAMKLIPANDTAACRYVARLNSGLFLNLARKTSRLTDVPTMKDATAVKFRARINTTGDKMVVDDGHGSTLNVNTSLSINNLSVGRFIDVGGYVEGGEVVALVGDVPAPHVSFRWNLVTDAVVGGQWQMKKVRVTVTNDGIQPIKQVPVKVRCYVNDGHVNDQTQTVTFSDLAPGATRTQEASFEMYNYQYVDAVSVPKAEVSLGEIQW